MQLLYSCRKARPAHASRGTHSLEDSPGNWGTKILNVIFVAVAVGSDRLSYNWHFVHGGHKVTALHTCDPPTSDLNGDIITHFKNAALVCCCSRERVGVPHVCGGGQRLPEDIAGFWRVH